MFDDKRQLFLFYHDRIWRLRKKPEVGSFFVVLYLENSMNKKHNWFILVPDNFHNNDWRRFNSELALVMKGGDIKGR